MRYLHVAGIIEPRRECGIMVTMLVCSPQSEELIKSNQINSIK